MVSPRGSTEGYVEWMQGFANGGLSYSQPGWGVRAIGGANYAGACAKKIAQTVYNQVHKVVIIVSYLKACPKTLTPP